MAKDLQAIIGTIVLQRRLKALARPMPVPRFVAGNTSGV